MHRIILTDVGDVTESVHQGLDRIEGHTGRRTAAHVVVKPNLGNPFHVDGVTVHAEVLLAVVGWLRDRFEDVAVVESDGIRYSCDQAFEAMNLTKFVPLFGGRLVNLSRDVVSHRLLVKRRDVEVWLPKTLAEADFVVSLPVVKSHELTTISGAIKNLFGCVPIADRIRLHPFLDDVLAELYAALRPNLVVGDGIHVMDGNGPIHGEVHCVNLLTFSTSPLLHDAFVASRIYQTDWKRINHLVLAAQKTSEEVPDFVGSVENAFGSLPTLRPPSLDLVAKAMAGTYRSQELTSLLYLTPLFRILNKAAWAYRAVFGRKPKFELHY